MRYQAFFSLVLLHERHSDRHCTDFHIDATPGTQTQLANFRCVQKPFSNGIKVFIQVAEMAGRVTAPPFITLPDSITFVFHLRLKNPAFVDFTDLAALKDMAAPEYTHVSGATELTPKPKEASEFTEHFIVAKPAPDEGFTLGGHPSPGTSPTNFMVIGLKGTEAATMWNNKTLQVNTEKANPGAPFSVRYPTDGVLPQGVFAEIQIKLDNTLPDGDGKVFSLEFKLKMATWAYYLVTDLPQKQCKPICIKCNPDASGFEMLELTSQAPADARTDRIAWNLVRQYPGCRVIRFMSREPLPCLQTAHHSMQLPKVDGEEVNHALPNPGIWAYDTDADDKKVVLYHVVKYFIR